MTTATCLAVRLPQDKKAKWKRQAEEKWEASLRWRWLNDESAKALRNPTRQTVDAEGRPQVQVLLQGAFFDEPYAPKIVRRPGTAPNSSPHPATVTNAAPDEVAARERGLQKHFLLNHKKRMDITTTMQATVSECMRQSEDVENFVRDPAKPTTAAPPSPHHNLTTGSGGNAVRSLRAASDNGEGAALVAELGAESPKRTKGGKQAKQDRVRGMGGGGRSAARAMRRGYSAGPRLSSKRRDLSFAGPERSTAKRRDVTIDAAADFEAAPHTTPKRRELAADEIFEAAPRATTAKKRDLALDEEAFEGAAVAGATGAKSTPKRRDIGSLLGNIEEAVAALAAADRTTAKRRDVELSLGGGSVGVGAPLNAARSTGNRRDIEETFGAPESPVAGRAMSVSAVSLHSEPVSRKPESRGRAASLIALSVGGGGAEQRRSRGGSVTGAEVKNSARKSERERVPLFNTISFGLDAPNSNPNAHQSMVRKSAWTGFGPEGRSTTPQTMPPAGASYRREGGILIATHNPTGRAVGQHRGVPIAADQRSPIYYFPSHHK